MHERTNNRPRAIAATGGRDFRPVAVALLLAAGALLAARILLLTSP